MLGIVRTPPSARAFHALLNNIAVGTFNLSRANGQAALDCVLVIELVWPVIEVAVALPHWRITVLCSGRFKMRLKLLQDCVGLIRFESVFLLVHPRFLLLLCADDDLDGCTEVVARMEEIDQVAALRTKFLLHLIGDPWRAITDTMNWRIGAKTGLHCTIKEALSGGVNIALERATKCQRLAALWVSKTYFCLFPVESFAFAFVCTVGIRHHDGYHATVCFDNDGGTGARPRWPALRWRCALKYRFGMTLGDAGDGAFTQHNAIVLDDFVHRLGKGLISTEVGDYAL